ncbi:DUF3592 domain-containing protein [Corynebacterium freneyi]|uniref:DUF3592 domain-containing protein n=1 Tax=Corynebacterium freneyi DNF00450 TaxID=1287475 RepID=A0A095Y0P8_9CORY|nr:DUF3592 domain-containing protein [Corynebacterium freneyi]KGF15828.1 hypothetical protein HMPREF1650_09920 [Corynebacterium freneyi DNF00450]
MLAASIFIAIGTLAIVAAIAWLVLRHRSAEKRFRTDALVVGSVGRPDDDLRAMVLQVTDRDGTTRTVTDTFHSNFAAGNVGRKIEVMVDPPSPDGEPGRVRVPRQSDPTFVLNALLAAAGVAFLLAGMFVLMQATG